MDAKTQELIEEVKALLSELRDAGCAGEKKSKANPLKDNITNSGVSEAIDILRDEMLYGSPLASNGYAYSWHSAVAMHCFDAIKQHIVKGKMLTESDAHAIGNDAASRFMKQTFDINTKFVTPEPKVKTKDSAEFTCKCGVNKG